MKKLNANEAMKINGGAFFVDTLAAMGAIYGAYEACAWAAKTGYGWGTAIGKKIFGRR